jgi:ketosteroid isomerase-like protein
LAFFHQSLLPASAADQEAGDKEALFNNAKAFVDAFEKGDAKAVAAFWDEDGDYVDLNSRRLQGRPAIENAFEDFFAENKGLKRKCCNFAGSP